MRIPGRTRARNWGQRLLNRLAPGPRILLYHRVEQLSADPQLLAVKPENFFEQLELLRKHFTVLPLGELVSAVLKGRASNRMVSVTFDDGYADNLYQAKPLLARAGIPATVYVASGTLNTVREFWWDELERLLLLPGRLPKELQLVVDTEQIMSTLNDSTTYSEDRWHELCGWSVLCPDDPTPRHTLYRQLCRSLKLLRPHDRESVLSNLRAQVGLEEAGRDTHRALSDKELQLLATDGIEIGGHTINHAMLAALSPVDQETEICGGMTRIEQILGKPVTSFSYPFGSATDFTAETIRILQKVGIRYACANYLGRLHASSDIYQLPRHMVRNWSPNYFRQWLES